MGSGRFLDRLQLCFDCGLMVVAAGLFIAILWASALQLSPEEQMGLLEYEFVAPGLSEVALLVEFRSLLANVPLPSRPPLP